ncbi:MAG: hypothetical protein IJ429_05000 [Lachnospiraceae bacterium]|nr:hypothetical protein [Lachnospiraceae bacterium]
MEQEKELTQEKDLEQEKKQKKSNKLFDLFLLLLFIGVGVGAFFYIKGLVKPVVSINGTELKVNMTVQELVDAGFTVDDSISGKGDMDLDAQPQIPGESYTSTFYYVYAKDQNGYSDYANVVFHVFNADVNSVDFKDSQIYAFRYDPSFQFSKASVLVNGIDFVGLSKEEAIAAFEELGVKFEAAKKDEFLKDESHIIFGKSGDYSYVIETDIHDGSVVNIEVKRKV